MPVGVLFNYLVAILLSIHKFWLNVLTMLVLYTTWLWLIIMVYVHGDFFINILSILTEVFSKLSNDLDDINNLHKLHDEINRYNYYYWYNNYYHIRYITILY